MTEESPRPSSRKQLQRGAVQGAMWTMLHTVLALPVAFLVNLVVARVLGVVDFGKLTYLTMLITIAGSVSAMGVGTAILQFGAKGHAAGRSREVRSLLSAGSGWRLLIAAPFVSTIVLVFIDLNPPVMLVALIFGVWLPAALGGLGVALNIENRTAQGAKVAMVSNLATQGAVLSFLFWKGTPEAVWAGRLIASSVLVLLLFPFVSRMYRRAVLLPRNPFSLPRSFWRLAIPTGIADTIGSLVVSRSEVLLLEWLGTPVGLGLFGLAFGLATHLLAPAQAFVGPMVPAVSGISEIDPPAVRRTFLRILRCGATLAGLFVAGAGPAFAALVPILYGSEFAPAADMVIALTMWAAVGLVGAPITAFTLARLAGSRLLVVDTISLVVNLGSAVPLIIVWGAWGAVVANGLGVLCRVLLLGVGEARHLGVPLRETRLAVFPLILAGGVASVGWLATAPLAGSPVLRSLLVGCVGTVAVILLGRLLNAGLTASDSLAISSNVPRALRAATQGVLKLVTVAEPSNRS